MTDDLTFTAQEKAMTMPEIVDNSKTVDHSQLNI